MSSDSETDYFGNKYNSVLKSVSTKKCALYSKDGERNVKKNNISLSTIMSNISTTVKTLQKADNVRIKRHINNTLNSYKKAHFVPVQCLNYNSVILPKPPKFETQCFSGTQLVTVVETAEAIFGSADEMNEEFKVPENININKRHKNVEDIEDDKDKTNIVSLPITASISDTNKCDNFLCDSDLINPDISFNNINYEPKINIQERSQSPILNVKAPRVIKKSNDEIIKIRDFFNNEKLSVQNSPGEKILTSEVNMDSFKEQDNSLSPLLKPDYKISKNEAENSSRSKSPILNISFSNSITCDLKAFENFEITHLQQGIQYNDSESSSSHINSTNKSRSSSMQNIVHNESIDMNTIFFIKSSPIKDKMKYDESIVKSLNAKEKVTDQYENITNNNLNVKSNDVIFEDELLFSSDEENQISNLKHDSLPSTVSLPSSSSNGCESFNVTKIGQNKSNNSRVLKQTIPLIYENSLNQIADIISDEDILVKKINVVKEPCNLKSPEDPINRRELLSSPIFEITSDHKKQCNNNKSSYDKNMKYLDKNKENICRFGDDVRDIENNSKLDLDEPNHNKSVESFKDIDLNNIYNISGFSTASKKLVKISEEALQKTKNIFDDIDDNLKKEIMLLNTDVNNKNLPICSDRLQTLINDNDKSTNIRVCFETLHKLDIIPESEIVTPREILEKSIHSIRFDESKSNISFTSGFTTASNKTIKISEEALQKTKHLFDDLNSLETNELENILQKVETNYAAMTTENNELNTYSNVNEGINDVRKIDNDAKFRYDNTTTEKNEKENHIFVASTHSYIDNVDKKQKSLGFTTNNKQIEVSEKAIARTKYISENMSFTQSDAVMLESDNSKNKDQNDVNNIKDCPKFSGFTTASNKTVHISEEALAKSKDIFSDIKFTQKDPIIHEKDVNKIKDEHKFLGFTTASNKTVQISEEALAKSKNIFSNIKFTRNDPVIHEKYVNNIKDRTKFLGFTTASNKTVQVSEEALAKSKDIFSDMKFTQNDPVIYEKDVNKIKDDPKFLGFTTASNKTVQISEEALAKSKNIFSDMKFTQNDPAIHEKDVNNSKDRPKFLGFTTASNKTVQISEEALAKSKDIFSDMKFTQNDPLIHEKDVNNVKDRQKFLGFTTASNKTVQISEEALAKSKDIFSDMKFTQNEPDIHQKDVNKINDHPKDVTDISKICTLKSNICDNKERFSGFTTANNKEVKISENALAETRGFFDDLEFTQNDNVATFPKNYENNKKSYSVPGKASNKNVDQLEIDLNKNLFGDVKTKQNVITKVNLEEVRNVNKINQTFNVDLLFNTQVVENFDEVMCTEDFYGNSSLNNKCKRSGSPILLSLKRNKLNEQNTVTLFKNKDFFFEFDPNYKKQKRIFLQNIPHKSCVEHKDRFLNKYDFENLLNLEFNAERSLLSKDKLHIKDLAKIFEKSVDNKILPKGWLEIQIKLILWKLISYELKFDKSMSLVCNAKEVLNQLKYRYERELNKMERPVLRKIYERDEIASKSLVLCVVKIIYVTNNDDTSERASNVNPTIDLELTDGWYFIRALIDKFLTKMVLNGKITVGTKLLVNGAELLNCDQGIEPWEDISNVRLKIFGNSTRRVRWHTKLGFHGNPHILTPLSTVSLDGGKVSKLRVFVARVYPMLFIEKFDDGSTVTRSQRQEELYQSKFEQERQIELEKLMEEIQNEEEELSQDSKEEYKSSGDKLNRRNKRKSYESGSQIAKIMKTCKDVQEFCATLTSSQLNLLTEYNNKKQEEKISKLQEKIQEKIKNKCTTNFNRNVVALLKLQIVDFTQNGVANSAILTIWKANESFYEIIKENSWIEVFDVCPTAFRNNELHLSAGLRSKITSVTETNKKTKMADQIGKVKRACIPIKDLVKNVNTKSNEIDTAGLIFLIEPSNTEFNKEMNKSQNFQNVYLTDENKNFICVNFWGGLKKHGFENILEEGIFIAGINLQKRIGNTRKNIPHFRVTEFSYFTKTPKFIDARNLIDYLNNKFKSINKNKYCSECVELKNKMEKLNNYSPYRLLDKSDYNLTKHKQFLESPLAKKAETNLTPNQLLKKQIIQEKMAKLEKYGEPPPLCPLNIINTSTKIYDEYKNPLPINNVASIENIRPNNNVATLNEKEKSPILNKNVIRRNYSKPVRLDFNKSNNNIDHFAEDFDCSPPLSFDTDSERM